MIFPSRRLDPRYITVSLIMHKFILYLPLGSCLYTTLLVLFSTSHRCKLLSVSLLWPAAMYSLPEILRKIADLYGLSCDKMTGTLSSDGCTTDNKGVPAEQATAMVPACDTEKPQSKGTSLR